MRPGDIIGWKLEPSGPVVLLLSGTPLPRAEIIEVEPPDPPCELCAADEPCYCQDECDCDCGRCHPREVIRYSSDPLLFVAMVAPQPGIHFGHG